MRVARLWDDPRIKEARAGNMTPTSINGFLAIVKDRPSVSDEKTVKPSAKAVKRSEIRDRFAKLLQSLEIEELEILDRAFDGLWTKMYDQVRDLVLFEYEANADIINESYKQVVCEAEERRRRRYRGRRADQWRTAPIFGDLTGASGGWVQSTGGS